MLLEYLNHLIGKEKNLDKILLESLPCVKNIEKQGEFINGRHRFIFFSYCVYRELFGHIKALEKTSDILNKMNLPLSENENRGIMELLKEHGTEMKIPECGCRFYSEISFIDENKEEIFLCPYYEFKFRKNNNCKKPF